MNKRVAIIMGSDSDWPVMQEAGKILDEFGVTYSAEVLSAHRMPAEIDRKSTRLNSSHMSESRMPSSA